MTRLARILLHEGGGDASFLVDGHKMPFIAPEFEVKPVGNGVIGVTVTFLCDDVLVLSSHAAHDEAKALVSEAFDAPPADDVAYEAVQAARQRIQATREATRERSRRAEEALDRLHARGVLRSVTEEARS